VFLAPGWSNYTAQGFGEFRTAGDFAYVLFNFSLPATVFISLAMYWAAPPSVYHSLGGTAYQCLLFYTLHRLNVAVKYGTLSDSEYTKLMSCKTVGEANKFQAQVQLLSSFIQRSEELIDFEIACASLVNGIDVTKLVFTIPPPCESPDAALQFVQWQAFLLCQPDLRGLSSSSLHSDLEGVLLRQPDGTYQVSLYYYVKSLINIAGAKPLGYHLLGRAFAFGSVANFVIPVVWTTRFSAFNPQVALDTAYVTAYYVFSAVPYILFFQLIFSFVSIAMLDARRRREEARLLARSLRFHESKEGAVRGISLHADHDVARLAMTVLNRRNPSRLANVCGSPADAGKKSSVEEEGQEGGRRMSTKEVIAALLDTTELRASTSASVAVSSTSSSEQGQGQGKGQDSKQTPSPHEGAALFSPTQEAVMPRLAMSAAYSRRNVLTWTTARVVLRCLGQRYKFRLDFNLIVVFAVNTVFFVVVFGLSIANAQERLFSASSISISSPITLQTFLTSFMLLLGLGSHIFVSAGVNDLFKQHKGVVQALIMSVEGKVCVLKEYQSVKRRLAAADDKEKEKEQEQEQGKDKYKEEQSKKEKENHDKEENEAVQGLIDSLNETQEALGKAGEAMAVTDELHAFTVLTIEASVGLLSGFLSLVVSAISTLAGIYLSVQSSSDIN
jgi:hypothetical protein